MAPMQPVDLQAFPQGAHERFMRLAIEQARRQPGLSLRRGDRAGRPTCS